MRQWTCTEKEREWAREWSDSMERRKKMDFVLSSYRYFLSSKLLHGQCTLRETEWVSENERRKIPYERTTLTHLQNHIVHGFFFFKYTPKMKYFLYAQRNSFVNALHIISTITKTTTTTTTTTKKKPEELSRFVWNADVFHFSVKFNSICKNWLTLLLSHSIQTVAFFFCCSSPVDVTGADVAAVAVSTGNFQEITIELNHFFFISLNSTQT